MNISALSLGVGEILSLEQLSDKGDEDWSTILRFDGPIDLDDLQLVSGSNRSFTSGMVEGPMFDTHFDLPRELRITFSAGYFAFVPTCS